MLVIEMKKIEENGHIYRGTACKMTFAAASTTMMA